MLHLLDAGLEAFLRSEARLRPADVDVSFAAPDRDWAAGVTGPTVNLFLWDVRHHTSEATGGTELVERDGVQFRRAPLPRVRLGYLVTVWAVEPRSEHQLLGSVLRAALARHELAQEFLEGPLATMRPLPALDVGRSGQEPRSDLWAAIGGTLRAAIDLEVTMTVDPGALRPVAEPPVRVEVAVGDPNRPRRVSRRRRVAGVVGDPSAVGAGVRSRRGRSVVDADGRFFLPGEPGDEIVVETDPQRRAVVPEVGPVEPE